MKDLNDSAGDVIALLRLTLKGDQASCAAMLASMDGVELSRILSMSLGFTAMSLRMLTNFLGMTEDQLIERLLATNEKMRNGDF